MPPRVRVFLANKEVVTVLDGAELLKPFLRLLNIGSVFLNVFSSSFPCQSTILNEPDPKLTPHFIGRLKGAVEHRIILSVPK